MLKKWLMTAILLLLPFQLVAQDVIVTRHFTGLWDQPAHENQGFTLHVLHQVSGDRVAVAYWFTYGSDDEPTWFVGVGPVSGNRIDMLLYELAGVAFLQPNNPDVDSGEEVGTLVMTFDSCTHGQADFDTTVAHVGTGTVEIERIGWILNTHCSGGISDDTPANAPVGEQRIALLPVNGGFASGHADFLERPDRTEFSVEVEDLPDGLYSIVVGGMDRGDVEVTLGTGETEFRSPAEAGKEPLTFDPRGQVIEIHDGQGAVLSSGDSVFEDRPCVGSCVGDGHGGNDDGDDDGGDDGDGDNDSSVMEIEVDLENNGVYPLASGEAELESRTDRTDFSVEIEDIPAGPYQLKIGGELVGVIEAVMLQDGTIEGELEFRNPVEPGKLLLDFDPRGKMIEVLEGDTVILQVLFPSTGDGTDDGGSDDGGSDDGGSDDGGSNDGGSDDGGSDDGGSQNFGVAEIQVELQNTGTYPLASGDAKLEPREDRTDFSVEIEDVPVGSYGLLVGGENVGTINAAMSAGGTIEGELEFRNPPEPGKLPLDFDPRGKMVQVLEGNTVILEVSFPSN